MLLNMSGRGANSTCLRQQLGHPGEHLQIWVLLLLSPLVIILPPPVRTLHALYTALLVSVSGEYLKCGVYTASLSSLADASISCWRQHDGGHVKYKAGVARRCPV